MPSKYLEYCVYPENAFGNEFPVLPGFAIGKVINNAEKIDGANVDYLEIKLFQCCRKLCFMWHAGDAALSAERDFYSRTIKDAPSLFGEDAIKVQYHLEAMVLFGRSSLDIASNLFGWTLPDPFIRKRYDSFNDLVKAIQKGDSLDSIATYFKDLRDNKFSWLSFVADIERGRSLRDKIAHQTEFPIEYMELNPPSEKESPVVRIGKDSSDFLPLEDFVEELRKGVVSGFLTLEDLCAKHLLSLGENA